MAKGKKKKLWIVVRVWRGFADDAIAFQRKGDAYREYRRLSRRCSFEEDDVRVFETPIVAERARASRAP